MASDGLIPEEAPNGQTSPVSAGGRRAWQGQAASASSRERSSGRRLRLIFLTGVLSGLVALIIVLARYFGSPALPPHLLLMNFEPNNKHFPLHPYAKVDSEILLRHFEDVKSKKAVTDTRDLLRTELKGLKERSVESLVIHLTALALVREGTVYILPADADPDSEATWLPVQEVLDAVEQCPAKQKLLILDLAHGVIDARLGALSDRVAAVLERDLTKQPPSYIVLCPCSADQTAMTSEILGSSVLAYFMDQGMMGAAAKDVNAGISVMDLVQYLQKNVDRWTRNNLGVSQQPRKFGTGADFMLVPLGRSAPDERTIGDPEPYPEALLEGWKKRDDALARGAFAQAPRPLLRLEEILLREETRWRAGALGKGGIDREARELIETLGMQLTATTMPPRVLSVDGVKDDLPVINALVNLLLRDFDPKKVEMEVVKLLKEDAGYKANVRSVVEAMSRLPELRKDQLLLLQGVLGGLKGREPLVEVLYADRLADFAGREMFVETFQRADVKVMWRTMREHEAVLAALQRDPEFLPWVAATIESADKKRRTAESKLLWQRPGERDWEDAVAELKECHLSYEHAKKALQLLRVGSAALERAYFELPAHYHILCDGPDVDLLAEPAWAKAAEEALSLREFYLAPPDLDKVDDARLDTRTRDLEEHLKELRTYLQIRLKNAEGGQE